jgi:hypothetical protein
MKPTTGPKAIALHPSFGLIVSASWLVCGLSIIVELNKVIARMLSAKVFFPLMTLPLFDPLPETLTQPKMNIGFFSRLFMAFVGVPGIGMIKLTLFSIQLVSPPVLTTPACTPVLYKTPRIPLDHPSTPVVSRLDMYRTKVLMYRTMVHTYGASDQGQTLDV